MSDAWLWQQSRQRTGYDVMQVCKNGHQITASARELPDFCQNYCSKCGAQTITQCETCQTSIPGCYWGAGISTSNPPVPRYCTKCGEPFPWQKSALEELEGLLREGGLSDADLQEATGAIPDIARETPKTAFASVRFRRVLKKLAKPIYDIAIKVVSDVASESAKKTIGIP